MKHSKPLLPLAAALLIASPLFAQLPAQAPTPSSSLTQEQVNDEILHELRMIRVLLERMSSPTPRPQVPLAPTSATITNLKGYAMGRPDAPLTMVEFTDLQCPYCRQYITATFEEIKKNWIDTGKLRYISRDFPLDFHAFALPAARAARCAGEQDKFWEMRMTLMRNANLLSADYIAKTASELKLDQKAFGACAASTKYDAEIQGEMREGARIGVGGTPTFVLGKTAPDSLDGPMITGALPYGVFDATLKQLNGSK